LLFHLSFHFFVISFVSSLHSALCARNSHAIDQYATSSHTADLNFTRDPKACHNLEEDMVAAMVVDPTSTETICITRSTPRLQFKGGQCIFFNDYRNVWHALTDPTPYFQTLTIGDVARQTICPVTKTLQPLLLKGKLGKLAWVQLDHGQRIFVKDVDSVKKFLANPSDYKLSEVPKERLQQIQKVHEALPKLGSKMRGQHVHDPVDNVPIMVSRKTPRVILAGGQAVFFRNYRNVDEFLTKPSSFVGRASASASARLC